MHRQPIGKFIVEQSARSDACLCRTNPAMSTAEMVEKSEKRVVGSTKTVESQAVSSAGV